MYSFCLGHYLFVCLYIYITFRSHTYLFYFIFCKLHNVDFIFYFWVEGDSLLSWKVTLLDIHCWELVHYCFPQPSRTGGGGGGDYIFTVAAANLIPLANLQSKAQMSPLPEIPAVSQIRPHCRCQSFNLSIPRRLVWLYKARNALRYYTHSGLPAPNYDKFSSTVHPCTDRGPEERRSHHHLRISKASQHICHKCKGAGGVWVHHRALNAD